MRTLILAITFLPVLFISCSKEVGLSTGDITEFINNLESPVQTYEIELNGTKSIRTDNAAIFFDEDDFVDLSGNIVTGTIQVEVLELLTKGQILLYGFPSSSNGKLLESAGEFRITASQDGQQIYLREGEQYALYLSSEDLEEEMELFYLNEQNDWIEADQDSESQNSVRITDTNIDLPGNGVTDYVTFPNRLGWINCDRFIESADKNLEVELFLGDDFNSSNTDAFLIFNDLNSVLRMSYIEESGIFKVLSIPNGEKIKVITLTDLGDNKFLFGSKEEIIVPDLIIELEPGAMSFNDIKKEILEL